MNIKIIKKIADTQKLPGALALYTGFQIKKKHFLLMIQTD